MPPPVQVEKQPSFGLPSRRFTYPTHAAFLSQAALLEEVGPPRVPALTCFLGFALVLTAIMTCVLVKIDVVSSSTGRIVSSTVNQALQSFDGGIVEQIHVKEGQIVNTDDLLITLRDPEAEAQLGRLQSRHTSLTAQAERLRQLIGINPLQQNNAGPDTVVFDHQQMIILPLEEAAIASEQFLVRSEIGRRLKSLTNLRALQERILAKFEITTEKLTTHRFLHQKNLTSNVTLFEAEREAADAQTDLTEIEGQIIETEATVEESRRRLDDVVASRRQRQGDRLSTILVDLSELKQQIRAFLNRLDRGSLRAPIRGIVHELTANFAGQIIAPGDRLIELIPVDSDLVVDARLPTSEISYVQKGQLVRIAVDGIEPHRLGYLEGEVEHLSPSTFIDENGAPYYQVLVALKSNELAGTDLIPGMTVQAQIKTDQRTILEYLLKPVYRAWNTAFRER